MARSALLAAVLTTTLAFVAAQPDLRSFVPSTASCPFTSSVTSPNQFAAARWCRLAEGGANTAITTAPSTPAVQTWGTRNWGNVYGGADGSGGPFNYRRYPLTTGGKPFGLRLQRRPDHPSVHQQQLWRKLAETHPLGQRIHPVHDPRCWLSQLPLDFAPDQRL
ncbi:hypothetical protein V8C86DRAFT_2910801 [Haematococcus lacustris]